MNAPDEAMAATVSASTSLHTRLSGAWLWTARGAWIAVVILAMAVYAAAAPVAFHLLRTPCDGDSCAPVQSTTEGERALEAAGQSLEAGAWRHTITEAVGRFVTLSVALFVFWRRSDDWMAHLASTMMVAVFVIPSPSPELLANAQPVWRVPVVVLRVIALTSTMSLFYLFPDGRFVPRWTRWLAIAFLPIIGILAAAGAPFDVGFPIFIVALATGTGIQIYRYRRVFSPLQRQQTKWVVLGLAGMVVPMFIFFVFASLNPSMNPLRSTESISPQDTAIFSTMVTVCVVIPFNFLPVTLAFSILRYRLWDVDIVINRALVYSTLTAAIVGLYVLVVGILGALLQTQGSPLIAALATGLVALVFQPLRQRLQRGVNRLMYGERDDPYTVLVRLGERLEATLAPDAVLPTIVHTVREALRLSYAAIALRQDETFEVAAYAGSPTPNTLTLPLIYQGERVGHFILGARSPGEIFSPADQRLMSDLARQAGVAAHAVRLSLDLRRSRERLITAREEERRRLRRDLHDGLGPALATQTLRLETARDLVTSDPAQAKAVLTDLISESQAALSDIRRLVYALRPPALDELGLTAAIREQASRCEQQGVSISFVAPERLPALPAAAEVAVYRIAQEALTNVVRHARARTCTIELALNGGLEMVIADDGIGLSPGRVAGIGLASMRERAEELGGSCIVEQAPNGGTRVTACLPLPQE